MRHLGTLHSTAGMFSCANRESMQSLSYLLEHHVPAQFVRAYLRECLTKPPGERPRIVPASSGNIFLFLIWIGFNKGNSLRFYKTLNSMSDKTTIRQRTYLESVPLHFIVAGSGLGLFACSIQWNGHTFSSEMRRVSVPWKARKTWKTR